MRYLESRNMVHRDLAARNVLVEETPGKSIKETIVSVKVADFGLATMTKGGRIKESECLVVMQLI